MVASTWGVQREGRFVARGRKVSGAPGVRAPSRHPSGARPPDIPAALVPRHVAIVMDGNGRWAKQRGLPRTAGHERGEHALFDVVEGAIEIGVKAISAYAFSTENWRRSPDEVRFLMGFNRDVIRRRRDEMHELGVRVRWAGREPRLWRSVIKELRVAEEMTRDNTVMTLTMCVNYGGRAEIADAARSIARDVAAGRLDAEKVDQRVFAEHLYVPEVADPLLTQLKAVDPSVYPFYGALRTDPAARLDASSAWVSEDLLVRLKTRVGEELRIGGQPFCIAAVLVRSPKSSQ